ncbi:hypothetical protein HMSSN036_13910 [Paenibacillus macerans]|uniref:hypothetical protein n=1 Tax=Paenibacillus sp. FSL R5-0527 TaxID=2975321 RepID=UPI00097B2008|nr:hypothetical protein BK140_00575 [Paenibacillus macerans]GJM69175.1 hypothetical protein HMSSN036_13910 [Paenibacillus macerans]
MTSGLNKYVKYALVLLLSVALILFTEQIKHLKNPESGSISWDTIGGLAVLWLFSFIGILISAVMKKVPVKFLQEFPVLGWVSITSLIFCLSSDMFVNAIQAVNFLSITTPILTFAGISVANRLADLRKTSWRVAIVAIFVFTGTYLGSAIVSEIGLAFTR